MQKLEVKARWETDGLINVIEQPKAAHCFPFFLEEKLALSRFQLGPSIFHKNRTILLPTSEFHQNRSQSQGSRLSSSFIYFMRGYKELQKAVVTRIRTKS